MRYLTAHDSHPRRPQIGTTWSILQQVATRRPILRDGCDTGHSTVPNRRVFRRVGTKSPLHGSHARTRTHTVGSEVPDCPRHGSGSMPCKAPTGGGTRGATRRIARDTPVRHKRGTFPFLTTLTLIQRGHPFSVLRIVLEMFSSEFCSSITSQDAPFLLRIYSFRFPATCCTRITVPLR